MEERAGGTFEIENHDGSGVPGFLSVTNAVNGGRACATPADAFTGGSCTGVTGGLTT